MLLNYQRRYDEAVDQLENTLEMDPDFATARTYLGVARLRRGEFDAALRHFTRNSAPTPGSAGYVGQTYALAGRRDDALDELLIAGAAE